MSKYLKHYPERQNAFDSNTEIVYNKLRIFQKDWVQAWGWKLVAIRFMDLKAKFSSSRELKGLLQSLQ